jgi:hypothetical protein
LATDLASQQHPLPGEKTNFTQSVSDRGMAGFWGDDIAAKETLVLDTYRHAPSEVVQVKNFSFGNIVAGKDGGTLILDADGQVSTTGSVLVLPSAQAASPALFELRAQPGTAVQFILDEPFQIRGSNGSYLVVQPIHPFDGAPFIMPNAAGNSVTISVGAEVHIPPNPATEAGDYTGNLQLTVVYE